MTENYQIQINLIERQKGEGEGKLYWSWTKIIKRSDKIRLDKVGPKLNWNWPGITCVWGRLNLTKVYLEELKTTETK